MNHKVYDSLDNPHARKNLYLKDVADGITTNKNSHSYIVEMKKLLEEEKIYLSALNKLKFTEKKELLSKFDEKEAKLRIELFEAEKLNLFYAGKEEKSYDFELESKKSAIKIDRLPSIIKLYSESIKEKKELQLKLSTLSRHDEEEKIKEFESKKQDLKNIFKSEVDKLKNSHSEGLISGKALRTQISQLKMELKDKLEVLKLDIPSEGIKSRINVLNYLSTVEVKSRYKIMQQDIADLYRKIPVEIESINKTPALLSLLFPGFGQYHNKQYFKAALFFIGLLFIYFVAIPYTLGYGNYRGEGIRGLISLAKNGKKLDKSIIFMIEGIISIILILFTITISYLSFKDAKDVMVAKLKGIRPKTTFETIESLKEEGFPYIVSISSFILLIFVVILPIMTTILLSFAGMDPNNQSKFQWIGFENYKLLLTGTGIAGGPFWLILGWTLLWTIFATTLAITVGFGLALLANNERIKGKVIYRTIYLLPWAVPAFITIMFFSIMSSRTGQITKLLEFMFGGDWAIKNSTTLTRIALISLQTWLGSSYVFLLSTGVLQGISSDLYEAEDIDGATSWQKLTKITVPLVLFQTAPLLIGQYTFNFNNFSIIYLFNGGGPFDPSKYGNLAGSTDLLISYIYKLTIEKQYQSIGAAITVFISIGLMFVAYLGFKNSKAFKEGK
ncbi:sugar ABC transporter permease [Streptobacillus moniliformis]|uniref:sugar ABC transporter permease n=1 Tax=Streptobacillus moniliformis TaxID=34105 RepID=UPI0007E4A186|nr:sugar ABC transporter permease [Streptobacillus moniliformis]